ncbi:MAG: hypothetical protein ACFE94_10105 [Candidatus Hodarchaeota archaeon]
MRSKNLKSILVFSVIINLALLGIFLIPRSFGAPLPKTSSIGIDGIITEEEWSNADWNISFYLDVNNTADWNGKINVDGNNTMYLGQDRSNLYIALDLWCDRSDNSTEEWVGVWLNTINRTFSDPIEWMGYLNDGAESLIHNVETDQPWDPFKDYDTGYTQYLEDDNAYTSIYGETEGTWSNFQYFFQPDFNITSELVNSDHLYRLDFSIDIDDWFPYFEVYDVIQGMEVDIRTKSNITIDNHDIIFWYNDGSMPPMTDSDQVKPLNKGTSYQTEGISYGMGNLTADHIFKFSLFGNHSNPFTINLDILTFAFFLNASNWPGLVGWPLSSIKNYQIEWGFGPSPGNTTDHRMFEISIPKSELERYKSNTELGIVVGGYGTMAIVGTNWWVFSKVNHYVPYMDSSQYNYYKMVGIPSKAIPGFNILLILATMGLISIVIFKKESKKF